MAHPQPAADFPDLLAAAWPPERWRDVHVVVAVSGGADSMALLRGLLDLKRRAGGAGRIHAAHVNHQLRGEASMADEAWLCRQCAELDVPLEVERFDTAALAAEEGDGIEAAARDARYRILTALAESLGARFVATGHTREDQVETVLFRLLRGAGLRGLAGMRRTRALSPSVALVRPMLACGRAEVMAYLEGIGQAFREDASNRESRFARNRVRLELLPLLREGFNPDVDGAILRAGELAGEAQALIEDLAEELFARCRGSHVEGGGVTFETAPLAGQREIMVCEVLRHAWRAAGFAEQSMTQQWWRDLAQFSQSPGAGGALNLPGNVRATRPAPGVLALVAGGLS
ncbi:MAG: tRNA lysidine(34) synthetase TilS [Pirellulales bacterium]|nr:tRNA lysidine(34) synthetase TilS [Pirellulales bacterium]